MTLSRTLLVLLLLTPALHPAGAQPVADPDPTKAGPYDNGKMWTFEYPPLDYLAETYDFRPDDAWFERARMSALRIPGCSASFVSPNGLVVTNHHCVRGRVSQVSRPGENLLDNGFIATTLAEERPIPGYYADQLIAIEDVTDEVDAALEAAQTEAERAAAREEVFAAITERLKGAHGGDDIEVQIIPLYNGGRHSAYVFRRYRDVRLVAAAELQLGFFGGEWDNFTYPRHALDFAFLRIYDEDGEPLQTDHYFTWSRQGVEEGDLIFVIGNPGSTSRHATVAQLEFFRDVLVPHTLGFLDRRLAAYRAFFEEDPEAGEAIDIRNTIFSISNSQKAYAGRLDALNDPVILARRADAERQFRQAIEADSSLRARYAGLFDEMEAIQAEKKAMAAEYGAFRLLESRFSSATIRRAVAAYRYLTARTEGADPERVAKLEEALLGVPDLPAGLERRLLAARLGEWRRYLGADDPLVQQALGGRTPVEAADALLAASALASAEATRQAVEAGTLSMDDPALALAALLVPRYEAFERAFNGLSARERTLAAALGRARFAVYGTSVPPDATFSPRFTDGIVKGYPYNGTEAPPYTTFYGMYDLHYAHGPGTDWDLPARWLNPPDAFNRATPLNFVSTADTIGGNSGSPAVTPNLEIVGLNFDRNIEGLSRDYIYLPERGRNIMVDVRAIREALDVVYDADRIVLELTTGHLAETEAEADALLRQ
ncbi:MAG: hypothetical protein KatS3mg044_0965 [Rhodothermaceae bacterium]|nr:MAG: hypothetical protein KatS3mg044_0965 [Rhodothermaceae bacterium]